MDFSDILSRLTILIDSIQYDETTLPEVYDDLVVLTTDIEDLITYGEGFSFEDLD
jgi:hypothetical protein